MIDKGLIQLIRFNINKLFLKTVLLLFLYLGFLDQVSLMEE